MNMMTRISADIMSGPLGFIKKIITPTRKFDKPQSTEYCWGWYSWGGTSSLRLYGIELRQEDNGAKSVIIHCGNVFTLAFRGSEHIQMLGDSKSLKANFVCEGGVQYLDLAWSYFTKKASSHRTFYTPWSLTWVSTIYRRADNNEVIYVDTIDRRKVQDTIDKFNIIESNGVEAFYTNVSPRGKVQTVTCRYHVEERYWGYRWLRFPFKKHSAIWVYFHGEIGDECGSWKGGCIATGLEMKYGETPEQCLNRMMKEKQI